MMRKIAAIFLLGLFSLVPLHGQSIRGRVKDKSTGNPLEFASVAVLATNPPLGAVADSAGLFVIKNVPVGRYDVQASMMGYESVVVKEILLSTAKETVLEIEMSENALVLSEITVKPKVNKAQPLNVMAVGSARMFSVEEASRYAGGFDDPARLATAFAGVTSGIRSNGIVVRGNAPRFLQWRLEEVEIPNPNHFAETATFGGGGLTAVSSQLLGNSDFFTGAFPAEYSNALSGVFDINLRNGNNRKRESTFQFGIIGIDFASEGPLGESNASYIFNYRYSTLALLGSVFPGTLPEEASLLRYQDLSFKLNFPTQRMGTFSVWGIGLADYSGQKAQTDSLQWTYMNDREEQKVNQFTSAFGLNHRIQIGDKAFLKTSLAATVTGLNFITDRINNKLLLIPQSRIKNTRWNFIFASSLNRKFGARHTNKTGLRITGLKYDLLLQNASRPQSFATISDEAGFSALVSAYTSSSFKLSNAWTLNLGVNTQRFSLNSRYAIEPRAGIRRKINPNHSVGVSYGLHSRLEMLHYYFIRSESGELQNKDLDFTRAHHWVLSYDWNISTDYHWRMEPYVQYLYSVPVIAGSSFSFINLQGDWFITEKLVNQGKGLNYGVDLTFEKYMSKGYYYMLTASLFNSRYKAGDKVWRNTRYNRNFIFNLLTGKEWLLGKSQRNVFNAGIRLSYEGGDRHTPVDLPASQLTEDAVYFENEAFSKQYAPVLICHFTAAYKINGKNLSHEIAFKVLNATLYKEYFGHRYNYQTRLVDIEREAVIVPNISYRIEF